MLSCASSVARNAVHGKKAIDLSPRVVLPPSLKYEFIYPVPVRGHWQEGGILFRKYKSSKGVLSTASGFMEY